MGSPFYLLNSHKSNTDYSTKKACTLGVNLHFSSKYILFHFYIPNKKRLLREPLLVTDLAGFCNTITIVILPQNTLVSIFFYLAYYFFLQRIHNSLHTKRRHWHIYIFECISESWWG